jgi:hypothetical protein
VGYEFKDTSLAEVGYENSIFINNSLAGRDNFAGSDMSLKSDDISELKYDGVSNEAGYSEVPEILLESDNILDGGTLGNINALESFDVKNLVLELKERFPGAELVCEVTNKYWVAKLQKGHFKRKFQRKLHLSEDAAFQSGLSKSTDMEDWGKGIEFLDDWTYFDEGEPKLGWFRLFKNIELLRRVQWTVHYKLD